MYYRWPGGQDTDVVLPGWKILDFSKGMRYQLLLLHLYCNVFTANVRILYGGVVTDGVQWEFVKRRADERKVKVCMFLTDVLAAWVCLLVASGNSTIKYAVVGDPTVAAGGSFVIINSWRCDTTASKKLKSTCVLKGQTVCGKSLVILFPVFPSVDISRSCVIISYWYTIPFLCSMWTKNLDLSFTRADDGRSDEECRKGSLLTAIQRRGLWTLRRA